MLSRVRSYLERARSLFDNRKTFQVNNQLKSNDLYWRIVDDKLNKSINELKLVVAYFERKSAGRIEGGDRLPSGNSFSTGILPTKYFTDVSDNFHYDNAANAWIKFQSVYWMIQNGEIDHMKLMTDVVF